MKVLNIAECTFFRGGIFEALHQSLQYERDLDSVDSTLMNTKKGVSLPPDLGYGCVLFDRENPRAQLLALRPDLIIFHSFYKPAFLRLARLADRLGIPYLIKPHGAFNRACRKKSRIKKEIADRALFNRFLKNASGIVWLLAEEAEHGYVRHRREYALPNGLERTDGAKGLQAPDESEPVNVIFVGRMDPYHKGLDLLLAGLSHLYTDDPDCPVRFTLYGATKKHPAKGLLRTIHRTGLTEHVQIRDWVQGPDKEEAFLASDLFILSSRYEGMPMGVLEALSYGIPCLLSEGTNMAHLVQEANAGFHISTKPEILARDIRKAVDAYRADPGRWKRGARALAKRFDWPDVMKEYERAYRLMGDELLDQKNHASHR